MLRVVVRDGTKPPRPISAVPKAAILATQLQLRQIKCCFPLLMKQIGRTAPVVTGAARGSAESVGLGSCGGLPVLEAAAEAGAQGAVGEGLDGGEGDGGEHQHARQLLP